MKFILVESLQVGDHVKFSKGALWVAQDEGEEITYFDHDDDEEKELPEIYFDAPWRIDEIEEDRAFISILSSDSEMSKYSTFVPLSVLVKDEPRTNLNPEIEKAARQILKRFGDSK